MGISQHSQTTPGGPRVLRWDPLPPFNPPTFKVGAYSSLALIRGWTLNQISMGNRMGRVNLRINITRVFRNCRNCPIRAYEETCDYLFITYRAKFLSKLGISKSSHDQLHEYSKHARRKLQNFQLLLSSEQVKAYDCYKLLIIKRKVQVSFIEKA